MKFIISSSLLLKNLQAIIGVINSNNTLPILDDFLFDLKDDLLTITTSDLETTMSVTYCKLEIAGVVVIEFDALANIYKAAGVDLLATYRTNIGG